MKEFREIMGMPVVIEVHDAHASLEDLESVFAYFRSVDEKFSTYKETSEITQINKGAITEKSYSDDMKKVFALSEETKQLTHGYFDIRTIDGSIDPSGLVKGWAIHEGACMLRRKGYKNFYVEIAGDIEVAGNNAENEEWKIGIREPVPSSNNIVKTVHLTNCGIATSGTYLRGQHIYNPREKKKEISDVLSITVIGPNIYEADRFATAAFAMGEKGIQFIEQLSGFEGYQINSQMVATMTSGFEKYSYSYVSTN